jgi:medium-chain acyl-[acyl-carrier-protein] hydrolase
MRLASGYGTARQRTNASHSKDMSAWIVCPKIQSYASRRLFCFPYAGVGVAAFRNWGEDLGPEIEVRGIQLPGRGARFRELPMASMAQVVAPLVRALEPMLDRPFAFYGHSLGANIAFEVARALRRAGAPQPDHLFAAASPAPQLPWPHALMHALSEEDFLGEIEQRYGGLPKPVLEDPEMRALLISTLRADVTIMETYTYQAGDPLGCAITAFGGVDDHMVPPAELEKWRDQTSATYALHMLPGDHFFLQSSKQRLVRLISAGLAVAQGA